MISSKKKKSSEEIELRSEKVRNLLGEIPCLLYTSPSPRD